MSDEEVEIVLGLGEYQKLKENAECYVKGMIQYEADKKILNGKIKELTQYQQIQTQKEQEFTKQCQLVNESIKVKELNLIELAKQQHDYQVKLQSLKKELKDRKLAEIDPIKHQELQQANVELQMKSEFLESGMKQLKQELQNIQEANNQANQHMKLLETDIAKLYCEKDDLEQYIETAKIQIEQTQQQLQQSQHQKQELLKELAETEQRNKNLTIDYGRLQAEHKALQNNLQDQTGLNESISVEKQKLLNNFEAQMEFYKKVETDHQQLKQQHQDQTDKLQKSEAEITKLKTQLEQENKKNKQKLNNLTKENAELNNRIQESSTASLVQQRILKDYEVKLAQAESKLQEQQKVNIKLTDETLKLRQQIVLTGKKNDERVKKQQATYDQLNQAAQVIQQLENDKQTLQNELKLLKIELTQKEKCIEENQSMISSLQQQQAMVSQIIPQSQVKEPKEIQPRNTRLKTIINEKEFLEKQMENMKMDYKVQLESIQSILKDLTEGTLCQTIENFMPIVASKIVEIAQCQNIQERESILLHIMQSFKLLDKDFKKVMIKLKIDLRDISLPQQK